ncbi:MAG: hypothetical protein FOGNACKC_00611 [Anaerolineae bacterium]|nr:hypothetical protein [Anaerolineae bacterium]
MNLDSWTGNTVDSPILFRTHPCSILLISDHPARSFNLQEKLRKSGCQLRQVAANVEAVASVSRQYYDVMVFDVSRPGPEIMELCREFETNPEWANIAAVVVMSAADLTCLVAKLGMTRPVYCLQNDNLLDKKLQQIMEQIHYLSYRYA